jgi:hypothetical protein
MAVVATTSCNCPVFRVVHFPTDTSAPLLRPIRRERFTVKLPGGPIASPLSKVFVISPSHSLILTLTFSAVEAISPGVAVAPIYPATLTLMLFRLPLRRGSTPPQGPHQHPL